MDDMILSPLFKSICLEDPFEGAIDLVRKRQAEVGDLFWSPDNSTASLAIVLAPEVAFDRVVEMLPLSMVALGECLAEILPPQVSVRFRDLKTVIINDGVVGHVEAAVAKTKLISDVPDWLVIGVVVKLDHSGVEAEPGAQPDITALIEEGWDNVDRNKFIEIFSRHFQSWLAIWQDDGVGRLADGWKLKSEDESEPDMNRFSEIILQFESKL